MNRYRTALAMGRQEYQDAIDEDVELLEQFGLRLLSVDDCIRAAVISELRGKAVHPWNVMEINLKIWAWLRPILIRLRENEEMDEGRSMLMAAK